MMDETIILSVSFSLPFETCAHSLIHSLTNRQTVDCIASIAMIGGREYRILLLLLLFCVCVLFCSSPTKQQNNDGASATTTATTTSHHGREIMTRRDYKVSSS